MSCCSCLCDVSRLKIEHVLLQDGLVGYGQGDHLLYFNRYFDYWSVVVLRISIFANGNSSVIVNSSTWDDNCIVRWIGDHPVPVDIFSV